jgi:hypothetical protein
MPINLLDDEKGNGGGEWLGTGWYPVTVESFRPFKTPNNPVCVEYILKGATGKTKAAFFLSNKAKYRLKLFAIACGLEEASLGVFEYDDIVGCEVQVHVAQNGKFHEVDDWKAV